MDMQFLASYLLYLGKTLPEETEISMTGGRRRVRETPGPRARRKKHVLLCLPYSVTPSPWFYSESPLHTEAHDFLNGGLEPYGGNPVVFVNVLSSGQCLWILVKTKEINDFVFNLCFLFRSVSVLFSPSHFCCCSPRISFHFQF